MKSIKLFKKFTIVLGIISVISFVFLMGSQVGADTALKKISAYQNADIHINVNGKSLDLSSNGSVLYPLVYEGHSYVSAKVLSEALGATVNWNADTQTVEVTSSVYSPALDAFPVNDVTDTTASTSNQHKNDEKKDHPNQSDNGTVSSSVSLLSVSGKVDNNAVRYVKIGEEGKKQTAIAGYVSHEEPVRATFKVNGYLGGTLAIKWKAENDMKVTIRNAKGDLLAEKLVDTTSEKETKIDFKTLGAEYINVYISSPQNAYGEFTIMPSSVLNP